MNTCEVPHVLTFEIRTVRPAVYAYRNVVLALAYIVGNVKLSVRIGALRVTGVLSVHPYHDGTASTVEVDKHAATVLPVLRKSEVAAIRTHRILVEVVVKRLYERRIVMERIAHIVIYGHVITCHFPVERHTDVVPTRHVSVISIEVVLSWTTLAAVCRVMEFPVAVEREHVSVLRLEPRIFVAVVFLHKCCRRIRDERGVSLLLPVLKHLLVLHP